MVALINQALEHPGLSTATGLQGQFDPRNYLAGTEATDFRVLADQLGGKTFMEAFSNLKGGGQITETEGKKATDAIARLNRAQTTEAYRTALKELQNVAANAKMRARKKAAGPQPVSPAVQRATNPQTGEVVELRNGRWVPVR